MFDHSIFTVGGTVQAGGGRYIHRKVDDDLLALCRAGTFAFVLTARQMGKSSLMVNTAQRLASEGTHSVIIDLSQIGVQVNTEEWYMGMLTKIEDALDLDTDAFEWWENHQHIGYTQRLTRYFEEIVLTEIAEKVVVFIDEIDSTLSLPFTDDFFAAIRYVHNARSSVPAFKRLSFVLIGVASPTDLISDATRTPFNIGQQVDVEYFTLEECRPFTSGFRYDPATAEQALRWILDWTGGHPYLTQRLCASVSETYPKNVTRADVDETVAATFFGQKAEEDSNIRFVHDMLTRRAPEPELALGTYESILKGKKVEDDKQSHTISHLKLAGIVGRQNGSLGVKNGIYASVFDQGWVKEQWPEHWIKRIPPAILALVGATFVALIMLGLFLRQTGLANRAEARSQIQADLNAQLAEQVRVADSLRVLTESANQQLADQFAVVDSARQREATANAQLAAQFAVADSLRQLEREANQQLTDQVAVSDSLNEQLEQQVAVSDSLRGIAESRLSDAQEARVETITIALANKASRQLKLGDPALGALLARQAFLFSQDGEGEFLDPVYDALVQSLDALGEASEAAPGGPQIVAQLPAGVRSVVYARNGSMAAAAEDGSVLFTRADGTEVALRGHSGAVRQALLAPSGEVLVTAGDDGTVRLWTELTSDKPGSRTLGSHDGSVWAIAISPDGSRIASAGADRVVQVWDTGNLGNRLASYEANSRVGALAYSPDGSTLVFGGEDGTLYVWKGREGSEPDRVSTEQGRLRALTFSPDGGTLVSGGDDTRVLLWDVQSTGGLRVIRELLGHEGPVNAIAYSPDGNTLATGSSDQTVLVWDVGRLDLSPILLQDHTGWVWSVTFAPDGSRLFSSSADRTVRSWIIRPDRLAGRVCTAVGGREMTSDEWARHVGADFQYELHYQSCSGTARVSN